MHPPVTFSGHSPNGSPTGYLTRQQTDSVSLSLLTNPHPTTTSGKLPFSPPYVLAVSNLADRKKMETP